MINDSSYRLVEGRNPALEVVLAGTKIHEVLIEFGINSDQKINKILKHAAKNNIPIKKVQRRVLEKLSKTSVHQGIILKVDPLPIYSLSRIIEACYQKDKMPFFLILTKIMYQYNLGALLRSALAAGVDAVIIPKKSNEPTAIVGRASMGAWEHMPIIYENIYDVIKKLKKEDIKIVAASQKADNKYYDTNMRLPLAILIGGEDTGIADKMLGKVDKLVSIPMNSRVESLNLSVAAAILMFEVKRQNDL